MNNYIRPKPFFTPVPGKLTSNAKGLKTPNLTHHSILLDHYDSHKKKAIVNKRGKCHFFVKYLSRSKKLHAERTRLVKETKG